MAEAKTNIGNFDSSNETYVPNFASDKAKPKCYLVRVSFARILPFSYVIRKIVVTFISEEEKKSGFFLNKNLPV